eukprot:scaffold364531_cov43-Prasinocladus_malaysianus.AAC.1
MPVYNTSKVQPYRTVAKFYVPYRYVPKFFGRSTVPTHQEPTSTVLSTRTITDQPFPCISGPRAVRKAKSMLPLFASEG